MNQRAERGELVVKRQKFTPLSSRLSPCLFSSLDLDAFGRLRPAVLFLSFTLFSLAAAIFLSLLSFFPPFALSVGGGGAELTPVSPHHLFSSHLFQFVMVWSPPLSAGWRVGGGGGGRTVAGEGGEMGIEIGIFTLAIMKHLDAGTAMPPH